MIFLDRVKAAERILLGSNGSKVNNVYAESSTKAADSGGIITVVCNMRLAARIVIVCSRPYDRRTEDWGCARIKSELDVIFVKVITERCRIGIILGRVGKSGKIITLFIISLLWV